jgi:hypothetical protein
LLAQAPTPAANSTGSRTNLSDLPLMKTPL